MWIRKTTEDIEDERNRIDEQKNRAWSAFGGPLLFAVLGFVAGLCAPFKQQYRYASDVPSYAGDVTMAPYCGLCFALFAFVLSYLTQVFLQKPLLAFFTDKQTKTLICNQCYDVKSPDGQPTCSCGGHFEDFSQWKWVDDEARQVKSVPEDID